MKLPGVMALAVMAACCPPALGRGDGTFRVAQALSAPHPVAIAAGDYNGDGKLDLAAGHSTSSLTVFLQGGSRNEWRQRAVPQGAGSFFLRAADFNADGLADLAASNPGQVAFVLMSNGEAGFVKSASFPEAASSRWLAIADFQGDGLFDVASANHDLWTISIHGGRGDGTFSFVDTHIAAGEPHAIEALDYDGDGIIDLVVGLSERGLQPFKGIGNGRFEARPAVRTSGCVRYLSWGDLNADGLGDLVAGCFGGLSVELNAGGGAFRGAGRFNAFSSSLGDLDRDDAQDLVYTVFGDPNLYVCAGRGDGTFRAPQSFGPVGSYTSCLIAADLEGDGFVDVVSADTLSSSLNILWGQAGERVLESGYAVTGFQSARSLALSDLDRDGSMDLLLPDFTQPRIQVYLEAGRNASRTPSLTLDTSFVYTSLETADLDGDGDLDLVGASMNQSLAVVALVEAGDIASETSYYAGAFPSAVVMGALDEEPALDLAVPCMGESHVAVFLGLSGAQFAPRRRFVTVQKPRDLAVGDLDLDGRADQAVISARELAVHQGLGGGDFSEPVLLGRTLYGNYTDVAIADVNGDGRPDVLVLDSGSSTMVVHAGRPGGGFEVPRALSLDAPPASLTLGDLDRNGFQDITISNATGNSVSVLLNGGSAGLAPAARYPLGMSPLGHRLSDLDGDGALDLIAFSSGSAVVLPGRPADASIALFRRGDVDSNGSLGILDPILVLDRLLFGAAPLSCEDAADANDDGRVNVTDPIFMLQRMFLGGEALPPPADSCGEDPTADSLAGCLAGC